MNDKIKTMWSEMKRWNALQWAQLVATIVTIFGPFSIFLVKNRPYQQTIPLYFILSLFLVCWILLIAQEFRYSRKARYAESVEFLHESYHALRDMWYAISADQSPDTIATYLRNSLKDFSSALSLIAGVRIRACVKELSIEESPAAAHKIRSMYVFTLCRSEDVTEPKSKSGQDWVTENSDFRDLFDNEKERCFFSNNLLALNGYDNSHWETGEKNYNYVSTVVWPIRKRFLKETPGASQFHERHDILGFLCIDSKAKNIFWKRYDFFVGAAYADTLYSVLKFWKAQASQNIIKGEVSDEGK